MYLKSIENTFLSIRKVPVFYIPPKHKATKISRQDLQYAGEAIVNEQGETLRIGKSLSFISNEEFIKMCNEYYGNIRFKMIYETNSYTEFYMNGFLPETPPFIIGSVKFRMGLEILNSYSGRFSPKIYLSAFVLPLPNCELPLLEYFKFLIIRTSEILYDKGNFRSINFGKFIGSIIDKQNTATLPDIPPYVYKQAMVEDLDKEVDRYGKMGVPLGLLSLIRGAYLARIWNDTNYVTASEKQRKLYEWIKEGGIYHVSENRDKK